MKTTTSLYDINDALRSLAQDVDPAWANDLNDDIFNELTHHVGLVLGTPGACASPAPEVWWPGQNLDTPLATVRMEHRYADWQNEVANGDTMLGFRDWLEHEQEAANP